MRGWGHRIAGKNLPNRSGIGSARLDGLPQISGRVVRLRAPADATGLRALLNSAHSRPRPSDIPRSRGMPDHPISRRERSGRLSNRIINDHETRSSPQRRMAKVPERIDPQSLVAIQPPPGPGVFAEKIPICRWVSEWCSATILPASCQSDSARIRIRSLKAKEMKNLNTPRRIILSLAAPLLFVTIMLTGTYKTNVSANGWTNSPLSELGWLWSVGIIIIAILCWMIWSPREPRDQ